MYGKLQQLAAATPSNQSLTLGEWNNNAQIAGQCTEMWPQQTCRNEGLFFYTMFRRQYGEKKGFIREGHRSSILQVFYSRNIIEHRLHVFWPKYLTRAATNRSLRFLSECGIFARLLIGLINAMAVAGADHFSHSAQLQK